VNKHAQRKVAVGLLVLAGGAWGFDRFVLGYSDPAPAGAALAVSPGGPGAAAAGPRADGSAPAAPPTPASGPAIKPTPTLAQRLGVLDGHREAEPVDITLIPASWPAPAPEEGSEKPKAAETPAVAAGPTFRLTAVVRNQAREPVAAWINGRLVRLGEEIEGHTLLAIVKDPERGNALTALLDGPEAHAKVALTPRADLPDAQTVRERGQPAVIAIGGGS
jgi:hypothetical protein